jgi:hypothetical protein|nr:MAG TPA: major capsid protein [Caudoviricetes sp.]
MSTVNQIYALINEVAKQTFGESAVTVTDTSTLVALGDKVLSSDVDTDKFAKTLVDRIGRTIFSIRRYTASGDDGLVKEPFEYGCIVQKIYVDLPEAKENKAWEIGESSYTPTYAPVIKPSIKQKLFEKMVTWEIDVTIPDFMFRTAFTSAQGVATLIDAIFTTMDNYMEIALENNKNLTRATFIANKLNKGNPCGNHNLLAEYNALTGATLTVATCMRDIGFLKWASQQINLWASRMKKMSVLFNDEKYKRHTPTADLVVNVLQDFDSALVSYLESDTYHNEMVKLANTYSTLPYWQGTGETYSFSDTSKIHVKLNKDTTVEQSGVIAVMYDRDAMGVTITKRNGTTERNNHDEYTNYYNKATYGYFNDMSENGIVFYVADAKA